MTFTVDKKLDNHREPAYGTMIQLYYCFGDKKITRREVVLSERTGYSLIGRAKHNHDFSINIDEIGQIQTSHSMNTGADNPRWEVFCDPDKESMVMSMLKIKIYIHKSYLIKQANRIPDNLK